LVPGKGIEAARHQVPADFEFSPFTFQTSYLLLFVKDLAQSTESFCSLPCRPVTSDWAKIAAACSRLFSGYAREKSLTLLESKVNNFPWSRQKYACFSFQTSSSANAPEHARIAVAHGTDAFRYEIL
jgi:hypothetical protein